MVYGGAIQGDYMLLVIYMEMAVAPRGGPGKILPSGLRLVTDGLMLLVVLVQI
jgi:hypothetical protein